MRRTAPRTDFFHTTACGLERTRVFHFMRADDTALNIDISQVSAPNRHMRHFEMRLQRGPAFPFLRHTDQTGIQKIDCIPIVETSGFGPAGCNLRLSERSDLFNVARLFQADISIYNDPSDTLMDNDLRLISTWPPRVRFSSILVFPACTALKTNTR